MAPVRFALVGLDSVFWPGAFVDGVRAQPGAEIDVCCDLGLGTDGIAADLLADPASFCAERGLEVVHSLDELGERPFDAALLATRPTRMPALAERLVEAGKHVYVSKPMGLSFEDAARYRDLARRGVVVTGGQLATTSAAFVTARAAADEGRIGDIVTMRVMHQHGSLRTFPRDTWYEDVSEGDVANWLGWYVVDALTAFMGPVSRVSGVSSSSADPAPPDQIAGIFELADGRIASASVYFVIGPWKMPMHEFEIIGTEGIARFTGPSDSLQILNADGETRVPLPNVPPEMTTEIGAFAAAIRGSGAAVLSSGRAAHIVDVCAAWRASGGTPADVPTSAFVTSA